MTLLECANLWFDVVFWLRLGARLYPPSVPKCQIHDLMLSSDYDSMAEYARPWFDVASGHDSVPMFLPA